MRFGLLDETAWLGLNHPAMYIRRDARRRGRRRYQHWLGEWERTAVPPSTAAVAMLPPISPAQPNNLKRIMSLSKIPFELAGISANDWVNCTWYSLVFLEWGKPTQRYRGLQRAWWSHCAW